MTSTELLDRINDFAGKLAVTSRWGNTDDAFGHLTHLMDEDGNLVPKEAQDDYIYEFACYMRIVHELSQGYVVEFEAGNNLFPRKPCPKAGRPRFHVKEKKEDKDPLFQVCAGTEISIHGIDNYSVCPDISIQKGDAKEAPDQADVLLVMDTKYTADPRKKISITTLREFSDIIGDLGLRDYSKCTLDLHKLANIKCNSLLTNGKAHKLHEPFCKRKSIRQVGNFHTDNYDYEIVG